MDNDTKYNGWTNYETWLVNLWFSDTLYEWAKEEDSTVDREWAESRVEDFLEDTDQLPEAGLVADLVNGALSEVNWTEIADGLNDTLKEE